ncbi:biotin-requiring enzyme [Scenedesmus sp. NREL 46B-D3]|nr:biotin-requiring enzyme [Scenedesmus sp. NREL 46B-D3]
MGDSISEGSIAALLKQPGDTVQEDDVIAQIETDKVTIDVKFAGKSGKAVAKVEEGDFGGSSSSESSAAPTEEAEAPAAAEPKPAPAAAAEPKPAPAAAELGAAAESQS